MFHLMPTVVYVLQYRMVKEALGERANLIEIAPHLAYPLPIMLPVYKYVYLSLERFLPTWFSRVNMS